MFYRFREPQRGEFFLVFADTAAGGGDNCAVQFLSYKWLDIPLVYHSNVTASYMTPLLFDELNHIYDITGIQPMVAFERNNGGEFEMDRLARLNRFGSYRVYTMKSTDPTGRVADTGKLGWSTNTATRPKMLAELKDAVESDLLHLYHRQTVNELFSFVVKPTGKAEAEDGAHDDCFVKNTLVLTDRGQVPIQKIKIGDRVMTRAGYQPVINTRNKRKQVITRLGLTGTPDHPVITKHGDIPLSSIKAIDTLYIWNARQSSIEERATIDIQTQNVVNIASTSGDTTNGKSRQSRFIGKYGLMLMARFQSTVSSIISTITPSITSYQTSDSSAGATTPDITCERQSAVNYQASRPRNRAHDFIIPLSNGRPRTPSKLMKFIGEMDWHKRIARQSLSLLGKLPIKRRVYNLQVANQPEYFANGILVHNCVMALAGVWQLYQTERPPRESDGGHVVETMVANDKQAGVLFAQNYYD